MINPITGFPELNDATLRVGQYVHRVSIEGDITGPFRIEKVFKYPEAEETIVTLSCERFSKASPAPRLQATLTSIRTRGIPCDIMGVLNATGLALSNCYPLCTSKLYAAYRFWLTVGGKVGTEMPGGARLHALGFHSWLKADLPGDDFKVYIAQVRMADPMTRKSFFGNRPSETWLAERMAEYQGVQP